jgi:hypothetical protein
VPLKNGKIRIKRHENRRAVADTGSLQLGYFGILAE